MQRLVSGLPWGFHLPQARSRSEGSLLQWHSGAEPFLVRGVRGQARGATDERGGGGNLHLLGPPGRTLGFQPARGRGGRGREGGGTGRQRRRRDRWRLSAST